MQTDDVLAFLQVVTSGSVTRAAKLMDRPKASLSHQIRRLEQELGMSLFDRRRGMIELNAAGREFLPHARKIQVACEQGIDAARLNRDRAMGQVRIATSSEFASNIMTAIFMDFVGSAEALRVSAMTYPRDTLAELCDQFDCILYLGTPPMPEFAEMRARKLGSFRYGLYASDKYLQEHGMPGHPDDLADHRLLVRREESEPPTWRLSNGSDSCDLAPDGVLVSNDPWVIKLAAVYDHGICLVPSFFARLETEAGYLQPVLPDWQSELVAVNALYRSHRFANPNLELVLDHAQANFGQIDHYLYQAKRSEDPS